jgi:hypothetical protein
VALILIFSFHRSAQTWTPSDPIVEVIGPTFEAYGDLLQQPANDAAIRSAKRVTFSYGCHDRQKLDLYTPSSHAPQPEAGKSRPILVFAYGGGFISGDKIMGAIPGEVVYTNLGYFFAEKLGFETIVMDYRLLNHGAKYPSKGEDVSGVMDWVEAKYGSGATGYNGEREIFMLGNSAGAVHVSSWVFGERFSVRRNIFANGGNGVRLQGLVFLGCPLRWDLDGGMRDMLATYYGGEKETKAAEPTALMERATEGVSTLKMRRWPKVLVAVSELDPDAHMVVPGKEFAKLWQERGGRGSFVELKGHNHLSPPLSLGIGIEREEAWGYEVAAWMTEADR